MPSRPRAAARRRAARPPTRQRRRRLPASQGNVPVGSNATTTRDFAYRRFGEITGTLVDDNGALLQGFQLTASLTGHPDIIVTTDVNGVFMIRGPPTDAGQSYTLSVAP